MIELVGYLGSALVVVSMLMSSVVKLRVINTVGSVIFATYAVIIQSYPTALMNACLVAINIYNLVKLSRASKAYTLVTGEPGERMLDYFLQYHRDDINKYFLGFSDGAQADRAYVTFCGSDPVGVLLGKSADGGTLNVVLDYTTPAYRDFSIGPYLYGKLAEDGVKRLVCTEKLAPAHVSYLERMGFEENNGAYIKEL